MDLDGTDPERRGFEGLASARLECKREESHNEAEKALFSTTSEATQDRDRAAVRPCGGQAGPVRAKAIRRGIYLGTTQRRHGAIPFVVDNKTA